MKKVPQALNPSELEAPLSEENEKEKIQQGLDANDCFQNGNCLARLQPALANRNYSKAAHLGNCSSQMREYRRLVALGDSLKVTDPNSSKKYFSEARMRIKQAADQGNAVAQINYALMLAKGQGRPAGASEHQEFLEARDYFKRAADQGNPIAQNNYAAMLLSGQGRPTSISSNQERQEALLYLQKAVQQGYQPAINFMNQTTKRVRAVEDTGNDEDEKKQPHKKPKGG